MDLSAWALKTTTLSDGQTERNTKEASDYALALLALKRNQDLRDHAARWLLWDPSSPEVYEQLGKAALALGNTAEAVRAFSSHAEIWSSNPQHLLRSAWFLISAGAYNLATELASRAARENEDQADAWRALGLAQ